MTDDAERTSSSKPQPDSSKLSRYKSATRWADERNNPCVKVTLMLQRPSISVTSLAQFLNCVPSKRA